MAPEGWKMKSIGDIANVSSGGTPSRKNENYWNGEIPWVTTAEVNFSAVNETKEKISSLGLKNSSAKIYPVGTILLAMYGQGKTRGKVAILGIEAATNQACAAIQLRDGYDKEFYYQYLQNQYENIRSLSNSGGQKNLSGTLVKLISVPVLPIQEQRRIASILNSWDKAISITEKLLKNSKKQKTALASILLSGKCQFKNYGKPWVLKSLDELFHFLKGKGLSKGEIIRDGKYECILYGELYTKYKEVIGKVESKTNGKNSLLSKNGDILLPSSTTTVGVDLARASTILKEGVLLGGDINVLRKKENINPVFLAYLLTHHKKFEIASKTQGITIIHLYSRDLRRINIKIPKDAEEQELIASVLIENDKEIEILNKKLLFLRNEKNALMQQLLTGKKRVAIH